MNRPLTVALFLVACGDDGNTIKRPDGGPPDAPRTCSPLTVGAPEFITSNPATPFAEWGAPIVGTIDGMDAEIQYEFYGGIEPTLAATFDLSADNQSNYSSCAVCVRAFVFDAQGTVVKQFFQMAGSMTLAEDPTTNVHMVASITGLQLQEVTIAQDGSFTSTPVQGGACTDFGNFFVDRDNVPTSWTCTKDKYEDGASCDCLCGAADLDCNVDANAVVGCAALQTCFNDECTTPPVNDQCTTATALALPATVTGTTKGAHRNYNMGLEGAGCTSETQRGPDVAYSVALTVGQVVTVTLSGVDPAFDPSISLVGPGAAATVCNAAITTCVAGADAGFEGEGETFMFTVVTAGTYYIIVDSFYLNQGSTFTLNVTSS